MRSVMTHSFAQVPTAEIQRSSFDRSHGHKTAFDADYLIPILIDEIVPGDTYNVNTQFFARLATPLYPIMDNLYLDTFAFFVPNRLVWNNWEKFCGAQDDPGDSIDLTVPTFSTTGTIGENQLADYFGFPLAVTNIYNEASSLPFRAYRLIWNEWFRDQNLQNSQDFDTGNGPDTVTARTLLKRGKKHDYFTSALPAPQRGDAVDLPLGTVAPVEAVGTGANATPVFTMGTETGKTLGANSSQDVVTQQTITTGGEMEWDDPKLQANLSTATAATINQLRLAFQTQRLLERDARSGTRYVETVYAHFGVTIPDFRVQRPEYLGGGSTPINITPVAQTSAQTTPVEGDALGQLGAFGTTSGSHGFTKSFTEHGMLFILANLRSDITYQQGLERYWSKSTRYDFLYPVLANIGEQSILNKEIYFNDDASDDNVWGYTERYNEYRYKPSRISGIFRSANSATLEAWHLSEDFSTRPSLGATFIESNTGAPLDRALAISSQPHLIADFYFNMKCARPLPVHGVPGMLDHF